MEPAGLSIGELARHTGVKPVTLRAWERRYGLLRPQRRGSGHRVYSDNDVTRVRQVVSWLEQGVSIGQVPALLGGGADLRSAAEPDRELVDAALALRSHRLDQVLARKLAEQPLSLFVRDCVQPVRNQLRHLAGEAGAALAVFDGVLCHKLGALLLKGSRQTRKQKAWVVVVGGGAESQLNARLLAVHLVEGGADVVMVPRALSGHAIQALVARDRASHVLLVVDPSTTATDWRRLVAAAEPQDWLVFGPVPDGADATLPFLPESLVDSMNSLGRTAL